MKALLKSVKVIDKQSKFHNQQLDVLIISGKIEKIGKSITDSSAKQIDAKKWCISPGFFDLHCNIPDPGFEHREDILSGLAAAAAGGFTSIAVLGATQPTIQDKSGVQYALQKASASLTTLEIIPALSINKEGKDITEMYDMQQSGAIAFSDGLQAVQNAGLMSRAMLYAKGISSFIISFADEKSISNQSKMNEGKMSTLLGMKGNPTLAEELMVSREIFLAEYNDAKVHLTQITSAKSVELIRAAKKKGVKITADVCIQHLIYDDSSLVDFDTNFKLNPPLRSKQDQTALWQGLKDGTIDAISTGHCPIEIEHKAVEFEIAKSGMIALQTLLPMVLANKFMPWENAIWHLTAGPRMAFGKEQIVVEENGGDEYVIYDPTEKWTLDEKTNRSRSYNTNFWKKELQGRVKALVVKNKYHAL